MNRRETRFGAILRAWRWIERSFCSAVRIQFEAPWNVRSHQGC